MFALSGAHRSGKTTTARAIADRMGIDFLETRVGDVFKAMGIDPKADLPFEKRLTVQHEILVTLEGQYALRTRPFIADRSPLDVVGYTMADIRRDTLQDPALYDRMAAHARYALRIVAQNLRAIMTLLPLENQAEVPGKAQSCPFYMDHVYTLIRAEVTDAAVILKPNGFLAIESRTLDLEERIADGVAFFKYALDRYQPEIKLWTPNS